MYSLVINEKWQSNRLEKHINSVPKNIDNIRLGIIKEYPEGYGIARLSMELIRDIENLGKCKYVLFMDITIIKPTILQIANGEFAIEYDIKCNNVRNPSVNEKINITKFNISIALLEKIVEPDNTTMSLLKDNIENIKTITQNKGYTNCYVPDYTELLDTQPELTSYIKLIGIIKKIEFKKTK